jgi:NADP-dependent 3-hydroxy acid dehydrogenase YdfG
VEIGSDTVALVTGASRGIGRAAARALDQRGALVGLVARSDDELRTVAGELGRGVALPADVSDREALESAISGFASDAGPIGLAVANAGLTHTTPFVDLEPDRADEIVRVNLLGTLNLVRAVLPGMLDRGRGHLVVVSSAAALRAFPWAAAYGASKAGQKAFAEALRHELSGSGVSLTTVYPGEVKTSLHAHELDRMPDWYRPSDAIPPEVVAEAIVHGVIKDHREVHVPGQVRLLGLNGVAPGLVARVLPGGGGGAAAPRRY